MRKKYKLRWAGPARIDLLEIAEFIAAQNPAAARNIVKAIRKGISGLSMAPKRGRVVPELAKNGIFKFRELIISPWRIVYNLEEKVVNILLVVDGRRDLQDVFFRRLMR